MELKRKIVKDTVRSFILQFLGRSFSFLAIIIVARTLGIKEYGVLIYSLTIIHFFSLFVEYGISQFLTREIANEEYKNTGLIQYSIFLKIIQWFVGVCFISFTFYLLKVGHEEFLYILLLQPFFDLFYNTYISILSGEKNFKISAFFNLLYDLLRTLFLIILSITYKSLAIIVFGYLLSSVIMGSISLILMYKNKIFIKPSLSLKTLILTYKRSFIFFLYAVSFQLYFKIDILMLNNLKDSVEVGLYSSAYKFFETFLFLPALIMGILYPHMATMFKKDDVQNTIKKIKEVQLILLKIAIPVVILIFAYSTQIISIFYGNEYQEAGHLLKILILTLGLYFFNCIFPLAFNSSGKEKYTLISILCGILINISMNFILIPVYGAMGASLTTLFSEFLVTVIYIYFFNTRIVSFTFFSQTAAFLAFSFLFLAVSPFVYPDRIFISFPIFSLVLFLGMLSAGLLKKEDFLYLKSLLSK